MRLSREYSTYLSFFWVVFDLMACFFGGGPNFVVVVTRWVTVVLCGREVTDVAAVILTDLT